jgi:tetratricopeptide (TPR) repeat protein
VVLGYLRDLQAAGALDPAQPVYVVELGAGSGRFGYHFLKKLQELQPRMPVRDVRVVHVLTDFAEENLRFWEEHEWLQPLFTEGVLDLAYFDAEAPGDLKLRRSGSVLSRHTLRNPLIVLANYFFDGIPHDAFQLQEGRLFESRVALTVDGPLGDPNDPALLDRLKLSYTATVVGNDPYGDPEWDSLLEAYRSSLPDTHLLFPVGALRCLRHFRELSGDRLLMLSADKGYHLEEELAPRVAPGLAVHGSFSVSVNYHALAEYTRRGGGEALHPNRRAAHVTVVALRFGSAPAETNETRQAFEDVVEGFGPDDFFCLKKGAEMSYAALSVEQTVAHLRLSGWDSNIFLGAVETLIAKAAAADAVEREALVEACRRVWNTYYPIGERKDLPFLMGGLLSRLGAYEPALSLLECSLRLNGPNQHTHYVMALCCHHLGRADDARTFLRQSLAADPGYEPARALRMMLRGSC